MPKSITQVQPPLEFIPPAFNPFILKISQLRLPWALKFQTNIADIQAENLDTLLQLYQEFQAGKNRFLLAFRHPNVNDPLCLCDLIWNLLPQAAKKQGIALTSPSHFHFIYDRGIPLWAGEQQAWLYSRLGGTPIHRGKGDRLGLKSALNLFINGQFPIAAAPEGATNGLNEIVNPLEPGIAQLGFWAVEELQKQQRSEQVLIVPVGIQYRYLAPQWPALDQLLTQLEKICGLTLFPNASDTPTAYYRRLLRIGEFFLIEMETYYSRFYHKPLPIIQEDNHFIDRLTDLLNHALSVAEDFFNIPTKGNLIDRCRRIEQAGWNWIYREDIPNVNELSILSRSLANRIAEESDRRMWHMRLVESFVAINGNYIQQNLTFDRLAETAFLIWDALARIQGDSPFQRPKLGQQTVKITLGEPISVSDQWETYQKNRRAAKQAIMDLTQTLTKALEAMIQIE